MDIVGAAESITVPEGFSTGYVPAAIEHRDGAFNLKFQI
jgi:hypothetical protein